MPLDTAAEVLGTWSGVAVVAAFSAAIVVFATLVVVSRRRFGQELRSVVETLEQLRTAETGARVQVGTASPLAIVADAVNRLAHDVRARAVATEQAGTRSQAVVDAVRDAGLVVTDMDGDIQSFAGGAAKLFGWEAEEVVTRPAAVLFEDGAYKDLLPKLARRSLRREGVRARSTMLRRDGGAFVAEVSVRMIAGAADEPVGFVMQIRDLAEQVELERRLGESEARYRALVEQLSDALVIVRDGRLSYVNSAAATVLGQAAAELVGQALRDRVVTADLLVVQDVVRAAETGAGTDARVVCSLLRPDGTIRVRLHASAIRHEGEPAVLLLLHPDAPATLPGPRPSEVRLDALLEATQDGILVLTDGPGGGVVDMTNAAFAALFGLRVEEYLGRPAAVLAARLAQSGAGAGEVARRILEPASGAQREVVVLDGPEPRELVVTLARLRGSAGEPFGRLLACRDLTEQRRSERRLQEQAEQLQLSKVELEQSYRHLRQINEELARRGGELDRLNQELNRLDEMKSKLLGNVSHELQTPLVAIRGYTEMILKERLGPITEEQGKGLGLALTNIDRLIGMIDNLAEFSASIDHSALRLARFGLRAVFEDAVDLLRPEIEERRIEVVLDTHGGDPWIEADREKLLQVFVNLLSNAVKFNRQGGRVDVAFAAAGPREIEVRVRDTGSGIGADALPHVFERGYRAPTAEGPGSGIGLSIVRDILRQHGCDIRVRSEAGRGSEFVFTLPRAEELHETHDAPPPAEPREPEGVADRPRLRIIRHDPSRE